MDVWQQILLIYIVGINVIGFCAMGIDKRKAIRHRWRIKESAFFLISIVLGSLGTWIGMYAFRHKTRHWYFVIGVPVILFLQIIAAIFLKINL